MEDHKRTYRQIITAITAGDHDALNDLMAADLVDHNPIPGQAPGLAGFKQWMAAARAGFPDLRGTVEQALPEGDLVAGRVVWRGRQRGAFAGAAPTGRPVVFEAYHIVRFAGGRAAERSTPRHGPGGGSRAGRWGDASRPQGRDGRRTIAVAARRIPPSREPSPRAARAYRLVGAASAAARRTRGWVIAPASFVNCSIE